MLVLLAGFVVGLVMSAPIGPMAALAVLRWSEGQRKAAVGVASGVCLGDVILAFVALVLVGFGEKMGLGLPDWVAQIVGVTVLAACGVWLLATANKNVQPATAGGDVLSAVLVTLLHPANIGAYGFMFMVWLPKIGMDASALGVGGSVLLVMACLVGMATGWAAFLWLVERLVVRFGRPTVKAKRRIARAIGVVMLASAAVLLL